MSPRFVTLAVATIALLFVIACSSNGSDDAAPPLRFDPETGDFSFTDSVGERVIYERAENALIVEPDINVEQLAEAFCRAEQETTDLARFSAVSLILAEALIPFVETVDRVCDR